MKIHNFGAGPCILPQTVLEQAAQGVLNLDGSGLSVLEISHRGKQFTAIMEETLSLTRELLSVSDDYEVLFIQGGASMQFAMVPMNLLPEGGRAAYLDTGVWSSKAIKEAGIFGKAVVAASSKEQGYSFIPREYTVPEDAAYFHITTNNTIYGSELHVEINSEVPVVADMSSNIFSKPLDVGRYGLIYAGAQKNMGPAGVTMVIVRKDLIGKSGRKLPSMMDYKVYAENQSLYNTPPVFAIYTSLLNLRWLKAEGGVVEMDSRSARKAALMYAEIDRNPLFYGTVARQDRSRMNAVFHAVDGAVEQAFADFVSARGIHGLKGHRLAGGFRASMYNALPLESVQYLVGVMQDFEKNHTF